jgi:hypothetical protein
MIENRHFNQGAAEHLVLGECLRRHIEAYMAVGCQPGWDIRIVSPQGQQRISVKAVDWPKGGEAAQFSVEEGRFDVAVIVLLYRDEPAPVFLIASHDEVYQRCSKFNKERKAKYRTLTISQKFVDECGWGKPDRWHLLAGAPLAGSKTGTNASPSQPPPEA